MHPRISTLILLLLALSVPAYAQRGAAVRAPGTVPLPYTVNDNTGNQWIIYQQGWMRQQGNMPLFGQAAMLMINGNQPNSNNNANQARLDDKTGEIVLENMNAGGVIVTRRIQVNRQQGYVRYIDVLKNPTQQEMSVGLQVNSNFNYGMQSAQPVMDPRNKEKPIGCAVMLQSGRAIFEMYAAKGSKNIPSINAPQNNNLIQTSMQLTIPAGKEVAFFHLHGVSNSLESATQFMSLLKEQQVLSDLPVELRRSLVNASVVQAIGDREILRGELFDVLELRGGDQLKGTLAEKSYKLQASYGVLELPAERVVAMLSAGQFRPRQLLVTVDGEVFGGMLDKQTIGMQLSSGQTTQVPLTQVSRAGYRKRSGEPEEWTLDRPMIVLRSGERMNIAMPTAPIDVMTRYGSLKINTPAIAAISYQAPDHGMHEIMLTDGSRFAGLVPADRIDVQLVGTASPQAVSFPAALVSKLVLAGKVDDAPQALDPSSPTLTLSNDDQLVGVLVGQLKLDTAFDTITINASEVRSLTHTLEAGPDVQIALWDQTTLSGQLRETEVTCALKCGVTVKVPIPMIETFANPQPRPSDTIVDQVKTIVARLSADDWKQREQAESQLVSMGAAIVPVLKELSSGQAPEARQRIDSVLKQLEKPSDVKPSMPFRTDE